MPYDPAKPANGALISAPELRSQFQGVVDVVNASFSNTSANTNGVNPLSLIVSDPPTQSEVQQIADKLDEIILALRR